MKNAIILMLLAISFASCKNNSNKEVPEMLEEKEAISTEKSTSLLETGCYTYNVLNNVINLEITDLENGVTGKLTYSLDGKDKNTGTFNGKLDGDKLFGIYTFMSEGVESKREIAFLVTDQQLIEGYAELNESGDAFKNKNDIKYASTMPLTKTDCDKWRALCLFVNGKAYSELQQTCLEIATLNIKLNPLKDGALVKGTPVFLLFDDSKSKVELFMPNSNEGLLMAKTNEGTWTKGDYKLIAWKGYVLQYKGKPIFGGE